MQSPLKQNVLDPGQSESTWQSLQAPMGPKNPVQSLLLHLGDHSTV